MMLISGVSTGAVQPLETTGKAQGASKVQRPQEETQDRQPKPVMDEYVPEEPQEPFGRYWVGKDEDGQPTIFFDAPEEATAPSTRPEAPEELQPAKQAPAKQAEKLTGNTDQVDREIQKLREEKETLQQQINREPDEQKRKVLEQKLAKVESELQQKDNDSYRRQHTVFTPS